MALVLGEFVFGICVYRAPPSSHMSDRNENKARENKANTPRVHPECSPSPNQAQDTTLQTVNQEIKSDVYVNIQGV